MLLVSMEWCRAGVVGLQLVAVLLLGFGSWGRSSVSDEGEGSDEGLGLKVNEDPLCCRWSGVL